MKRKPKCHGITVGGTPCQAHAIQGGKWCFFHDPAKREEHSQAARKGAQNGRAGLSVMEGGELQLETAADTKAAYARILNEVRRGDLDYRIGNCIAGLLSGFLNCTEKYDLAERLDQLEKSISERLCA